MSQSVPTTALGWQDFFSTTLDGSITSTDTTIGLASAPTPTEGFLVIEPDSTTNREIIMYTSVSGNDVVCGSVDDRGIGGTTARAHSSGVIVKMNTVSDMFEALQSGKGLADAAITPAKLLAGTGTSWAWQSWTPTLSGRFDDGDWTKDCKYIQIGKTVFFRLHLTATAAAPMGGGVAEVFFTLPVTAAAIYGTSTNVPLGTVHMQDTGTATYLGAVYTTSSATLGTARHLGATSVFTGISSTAPFTWTTGDLFVAVGTYEAA